MLEYFNNIQLAKPEFLWLLIVLIPMLVWYIWKNKDSHASIQLSTISAFYQEKKKYKFNARHILFVIRMFVVALLIFILAKPQTVSVNRNSTAEGIDIVLALDISSSMLALDFEPNRLEAAKKVANEFINGRENDRIGLVAFSAESFTQCPLTTDRSTLINSLYQLEIGLVDDGTAVGLGLANAVARLKESKNKSKVVILLTDGVNNSGTIAPLTAADIAFTYGVKVYTVGIGKNGYAQYPVQTIFGVQYQQMEVEIDEETLIKIAEKTNGKYFRATNEDKLIQIYKEIDKLEKMEIDVDKEYTYYHEYHKFALLAGLLLLFEIFLRNTILRTNP